MTILTFLKKRDIPAGEPGTSQDVAIGASSAQSTAIGTAGDKPKKLVRIAATTACRILVGTNPTATTTSTLLFANSAEFIWLTPGYKIAVLQETAAGKLNITEYALPQA